jgi:glycosyltransferase involved in cell wall biosynthesis
MSPDSTGGQVSPLLSIAVPNRNQIRGLETQESALRGFVENFGIEVLVSDNHSDDLSQDYLQENWSDFAKIFFLQENIGFLGNLRNLAERAAGEWIWFLGSGDLPNLSAIGPFMELLNESTEVVNSFIDDGDYACVAPYLGGVVFRRSRLLESISAETDEIWPHVSWSIDIQLRYPDSKVNKSPLMHVEPWSSSDDWHATKSMFPYAEVLNRLLHEGVARASSHKGLSSDLRQSQKTLLTWYVQDRMGGKVRGLNKNLWVALRLSGKITDFFKLKILSLAISVLPLSLLSTLKQLRRQ